MNVLFLAPNYPPEMREFTRGLAQVSAHVYGMGDGSVSSLDRGVRAALTDYRRVNLHDTRAVLEAAAAWGVEFDRVECLWEPFVELAAQIREHLGVPGMSYDTAKAFRDKELMKQRVEAAGLRVPYHARARTAEEVWSAAALMGYPLIIKPIAGAGSADTYRVNGADELRAVIRKTAHVEEVSVEEFVDGEEFTFDTVCIDGRPAFFNIAQYHPRPLLARSNEWISPIVTCLRDVDDPKYTKGIELGLGVLKALKMGTGFTHMEWYRKKDGEVVFGEIGARSAGGHLVDQMNFANDIDLFREWARSVCWRSFEAPTRRLYNVAIIFKRAHGQGKITRIEGLDRYLAKYGRHVVAETLLRPGHPRRDWMQTLVSDGFLIVRHPDLGETMKMAEAVASDIQLYAGG